MIIDKNLFICSQYFEYNQAQKQNNNNPPTTIDQNGYCYKLAPISA